VPVNNYYARAREDDYAPVAMGCPNTHESMEWMWARAAVVRTRGRYFTAEQYGARNVRTKASPNGEVRLALPSRGAYVDGYFETANGERHVLEYLECPGSHYLCPACRLDAGKCSSFSYFDKDGPSLLRDTEDRLREIAEVGYT